MLAAEVKNFDQTLAVNMVFFVSLSKLNADLHVRASPH